MRERIERLILQINTLAMKAYIAQGIDAQKTVGAYDRQLWRAALDFFRGDADAFAFIDDFTTSITEQLTRAWNEGAREANFDPRDMSDADLSVLDDIIANEQEYILGLAEDIEQARLDGMTLADFRQQFRARIDIWVNRYNDVVNRSKLYFGTMERYEWIMGATEQHCVTCAALNGVVATAEEWDASGYRPQSPPNDRLECGGWRCDCSLQPTDKPKTRGGIPNV